MRQWTAPVLRRASCSNYKSLIERARTVTRRHSTAASAQVPAESTTKHHKATPASLLSDASSPAASAAPKFASSSTSSTSSKGQSSETRIDPYKILAPELESLRNTLLHLLGSSHPSLTTIAQYYFLHPSKQLRPLLVLLFANATNGLGGDWGEKRWAAEQEGARGRTEELDSPLSRPEVLNDWNPNMPDSTRSFENVFDLPPPRQPTSPPVYTASPSSSLFDPTLVSPSFILPSQKRLAQIVEMIHVASLLHDDVIDASPLRRGVASAPAAFGNKLSVLAGDFLLGRASAALSRLGSSEVTELIASVIANLVEGEILQMQQVRAQQVGQGELGIGVSFAIEEGVIGKDDIVGAAGGKGKEGRVSKEMWNVYLKKTYLKTASLMAKGARAAVVLGGSREGEIWKEVAYAYGRNLGIAFQVRYFPYMSLIAY